MTTPKLSRGRTSLRTELVVVTVVLLVLGLAIAATLAVTEVRGYLLAQVDQQLRAAGHPVSQSPDEFAPAPAPGVGGDGVGGRGGEGPGAPSLFTIAYLDNTGTVTSYLRNPLSSQTEAPQLPAWTIDQVRAAQGQPFTVSSQQGGEPWRVLALPRPDGVGSVMVAQSLAPMTDTVRRLELTELAAGAFLVVLLAVAASLLVRRSLRPLRSVEQTAGALADGDLAQRVPTLDERTEVGQLAASFNRMADRIQSAFAQRAASEAAAKESEQRMRRFAADASHELRTPLTSIRGYAELYEQGAIADDEHVAQAMSRIQEQATRMGLLVDDLLLLARMDQQRPLQRGPVDVVAVVIDAVADARSGQPDRPIDLTVAVPGRLVIDGDDPALRQVVGNLLANALRHTPRDAAVHVRIEQQAEQPARQQAQQQAQQQAAGAAGSEHPAWAIVEVTDEGPGLTPGDAARVFERFYRTDAARTRDLGGTGLGLSIVDTLVRAHGGRVDVVTSPGEGATFRVALPVAAPQVTDPPSRPS
jgi:two-component system OmpR family sensor kinase